jgi:hypothetical protein
MSLGHTTYTQKITDTAGDCMKYLHSYWGNLGIITSFQN